jgi:peptidoglycan/LPS O-acetylase OafA/YrhL
VKAIDQNIATGAGGMDTVRRPDVSLRAPAASGCSARLIAALSRVTSSGEFIPIIDGLRFVAIVSVLLYHLFGYVLEKSPENFSPALRLGTWLGWTLDKGWFGVNLFFVISGFIISLPFATHYLTAGRKPVLRNYYFRRVTRLEPPYMICITLIFLLELLVKKAGFIELGPHYLATLFYGHNIIYGTQSTVSSVAWSLEIEIQFYLIAPLITHVFAIEKPIVRRGLIVGGIAAACLLQPIIARPDFLTLFMFVQYFLTGFLLADVFVVDWQRAPAASYAMDGVAIAAAGALYVITNDSHAVYFNATTALLACMALFWGCFGVFRGQIVRRILTNRWIVVIGGMCYTIYLYHEHVYSLIGRFTVHIPSTHHLWADVCIQTIAIGLPTLVCVSLLFYVLEKPFMRKEWPFRLAAAVRNFRAVPVVDEEVVAS